MEHIAYDKFLYCEVCGSRGAFDLSEVCLEGLLAELEGLFICIDCIKDEIDDDGEDSENE
jgi:hypothetical protein